LYIGIYFSTFTLVFLLLSANCFCLCCASTSSPSSISATRAHLLFFHLFTFSHFYHSSTSTFLPPSTILPHLPLPLLYLKSIQTTPSTFFLLHHSSFHLLHCSSHFCPLPALPLVFTQASILVFPCHCPSPSFSDYCVRRFNPNSLTSSP